MSVLCLKLRSRNGAWNPSKNGLEGEAKSDKEKRIYHRSHHQTNFHASSTGDRIDNMSPPLPVTEDTPPDMLAGAMDLQVVLPNGRDIKMSVERSTPMMDLLVHVTTSNKISPGGHIIQAIGDRGVLPYKPSTPIGALDTWTIHIVPKKQAVGNAASKKKIPVVSNSTPFEQTFRLQVHLPRNQLYVTRIGFQTRLADVLHEVCEEKGLDLSKYCLIHPDKLEEKLDLEKTFYDYKLQQVALVNKNNRPIGLSSTDIMTLKYSKDCKSQNKKYASHLCEGSISSGSLEGRSLSPTHSEESSSSPTMPKPKAPVPRPYRKRRPAPKPPQVANNVSSDGRDDVVISHSRNSSDSSGYHESSVLSESPETNSLPDSLKRRSKLPSAVSSTDLNICVVSNVTGHHNNKIGNNNLSRSLSNLATIVESSNSTLSRFESNAIGNNNGYSASSTSLASLGARKKKPPAPPPPMVKKPCSMLSLKEEEVSTADSVRRLVRKECDDDDDNKMTSCIPLEPPSPFGTCSKIAISSSNIISSTSSANKDVNPPADLNTYPIRESADDDRSVNIGTVDDLIMDDDEIDRIFHDATKDYETPSLCSLPTSVNDVVVQVGRDDTNRTDANLDLNSSNVVGDTTDVANLDWRYKLPEPPSAFRDHVDFIKRHDTTGNFPKSSIVVVTPERRSDDVDNVLMTTDTCLPTCTIATANTTDVDNNNNNNDDSTNDDNNNSDDKPIDINNEIGGNDLTSITTNDSGVGSDDSSLPSTTDSRHRRHLDECPPDDTHYDTHYDRYRSKNKTLQPVVGNHRIQRRASALENFTISSYRSSKPTEIFRDDSVKTSKTTQLAIINHPSTRILSNNNNNNNISNNASVARHSSFSNNDYKKPNNDATSTAVKRSKSHISLLSGNYTKFNRLIKKQSDSNNNDDQQRHRNYTESINDDNRTTPLKKYSSEINVVDKVNEDDKELLELQDEVLRWKQRVLMKESILTQETENVPELQSLQVLRGILPQINKTFASTNSPSTDEVNHRVPKEMDALDEDKFDKRSTTLSSTRVTIKEKPSNGYYRDNNCNEKPPSVNVTSWNERPKRQVSIKLDNDYVYNNRNNTNNNNYNNSNHDNNSNSSRKEKKSISTIDNNETRNVNNNNNNNIGKKCNFENNDNVKNDLSHVPIVRAVEFKKPFVPKINNHFISNNNNNNNNNTNTKKSIPSYLFGCDFYNKNNKSSILKREQNRLIQDQDRKTERKSNDSSLNTAILNNNKPKLKNVKFGNCSVASYNLETDNNDNVDYDDDKNIDRSKSIRKIVKSNSFYNDNNSIRSVRSEFQIGPYNKIKTRPQFEIYRDEIDKPNEIPKNNSNNIIINNNNNNNNKSSSSKYSVQKAKVVSVEDFRDDLLQSIRGFDRDRLKRIRVK